MNNQQKLASAVIVVAWIGVATWGVLGGDMGVVAAAMLLSVWIASLWPRRVPRSLALFLGTFSVVTLVSISIAGARVDSEAGLSVLLMIIGAVTVFFQVGHWRFEKPDSMEFGSLSIDGEMETRDWSGREFDDSGIVGPLVVQTGADFVRRAHECGAFTATELAALEDAFRASGSPVKTLKTLIASEELTKFQVMHLLWGQESQLRFGEYNLVEVIGRGASSTVYRARFAKGDDPVAIKVLHADQKALKRVHREMQSVRKLAHPNIVVAYDSGKANSRYYIAMELVHGPDLNQVVRKRGPLGEREALVSVLQTALALQQAHERGILHRDVKPGNMLLTPSGDVKLADLGLSCPIERRMKEAAEGSFETDENSLGGTIEFMAPEQVKGFRDVDARADTFALGSSLFFLLTGCSRLPRDCLADHINNLTIHRKFLPTGDYIGNSMIVDLIDRLSAFDADDRIASMSEAVDAIRETIAHLGQPHRPNMIRVLVIEDNHADMYLTLAMLAKMNRTIETHEAGCLADGLIAMENRIGESSPDFDIVLLDANLPDSHGDETIKRFRNIDHDVAVIMLSGQDDNDFRDACLQNGANSYLHKRELSAERLEREIFVTLARSSATSASEKRRVTSEA